jgi:hypothetical protein
MIDTAKTRLAPLRSHPGRPVVNPKNPIHILGLVWAVIILLLQAMDAAFPELLAPLTIVPGFSSPPPASQAAPNIAHWSL